MTDLWMAGERRRKGAASPRMRNPSLPSSASARPPRSPSYRKRLIHPVPQLSNRHCLMAATRCPILHGVIDRGRWEALPENIQEQA